MGEEYVFQHYVPQFYLRNFRSADEFLYCLNVNEDRRFRLNASNDSRINMAASDYFYDTTEERVFERGMGKFESEWANSAQKLLTKASIESISEEMRADLLIFITMQYIRTRSNRSEMLEAFKDFEGKHDGTDIGDFMQKNEGREAHIMLMESVTELLSERLYEYGAFRLYINYSQIPFITSDNPVAHYHHRNPHEYDYRDAIGVGGSDWELYFPLTPRYCLSIRCSVEFGDEEETVEVEDTELPELQNTLQLVQASDIAVCNNSSYNGINEIW